MRCALLLVCSLLLAATSVAAQNRSHVLALRPGGAGLRGALPAGREIPPTTSPIPAPAGSTALAQLLRPNDPAQCRAGCAQQYYFCAAANDSDLCSTEWGQCRAACDAPRFTIPRVAGAR